MTIENDKFRASEHTGPIRDAIGAAITTDRAQGRGVMGNEPLAKAIYAARFANTPPRTFTPWEDLPQDAKEDWFRCAEAAEASLESRLAEAERERDNWKARADFAKAIATRLTAALEQAKEGLKFYSERMTYTARTGMECGITRDHFGDKARATLAQIESALKENGNENA